MGSSTTNPGLDELRRFTAAASRADWIDRYGGVAHEIDWILAKRRLPFSIESREIVDGDIRFRLVWQPTSQRLTLQALQGDFFDLFGQIACREQYICRSIEGAEVVYSVLMGRSDSTAYGFYVRITVCGPAIEQVIRRTTATK